MFFRNIESSLGAIKLFAIFFSLVMQLLRMSCNCLHSIAFNKSILISSQLVDFSFAAAAHRFGYDPISFCGNTIHEINKEKIMDFLTSFTQRK